MIRFNIATTTLAAVAALTLGGCGDALTAEELGAEGLGDESFETFAQDFSVDACARAREDATLMGDSGRLTTPRSYNTCTKSFVVNIQNSNAGRAELNWGELTPSTATACRDTELHAIVYTLNSAQDWVMREQQTLTGVWSNTNNRCNVLVARFDLSALGARDFRIAGTARQISGGNPTRKFNLVISR